MEPSTLKVKRPEASDLWVNLKVKKMGRGTTLAVYQVGRSPDNASSGRILLGCCLAGIMNCFLELKSVHHIEQKGVSECDSIFNSCA